MDWLDLLAVQRTLKSLLQHHTSKASILRRSAFIYTGTHFIGILVVAVVVNKNSRFYLTQILTEKCLQPYGKGIYSVRRVALGSGTPNVTT